MWSNWQMAKLKQEWMVWRKQSFDMPANAQECFLVGTQRHIDKDDRSSQRPLCMFFGGFEGWIPDWLILLLSTVCFYLNMTTISPSYSLNVTLHWFLLMTSLCSLCFATCDLWTTQAHTKRKGTSQKMRYRFFANVQSISWIIAALWIMLLQFSCLFLREDYWPRVNVTFTRITEWRDQFQQFDKSVGLSWLI